VGRLSPRSPWLVEVLLDAAQRTASQIGITVRIPASSSELDVARKLVSDAAAGFGLDSHSSYEFVYAANEAVTNAIRHGSPDSRGFIELSVQGQGDRLTLIVRDFGTFKRPAASPSSTAENGRGFALMTSLTDDLQLTAEPGCTTIRLSKLLGMPAKGIASDA
jgi:anti-sigma regulatory factor (Ser/Thr protein kinase)